MSLDIMRVAKLLAFEEELLAHALYKYYVLYAPQFKVTLLLSTNSAVS